MLAVEDMGDYQSIDQTKTTLYSAGHYQTLVRQSTSISPVRTSRFGVFRRDHKRLHTELFCSYRLRDAVTLARGY